MYRLAKSQSLSFFKAIVQPIKKAPTHKSSYKYLISRARGADFVLMIPAAKTVDKFLT